MEIHVREQCSGCQGKGFFPAPLLLNGEVSCGPCNGTGYIESWVEIPYTLEEFKEQLSFLRTGRAIRYELHLRDRMAQVEKGN